MMTALLLYAYASGERSSRRIEARCRRDVAYRIITANQAPDHATIARFRADHEAALSHLCDEVLRLCAAAGLGRLGLIALDGTKIAANAALGANRTIDRLSAEIEAILAEAAAVDAAEDAEVGADQRGDELPRRSPIRAVGLERLRAAKRELARAEAARVAAHEAHLAHRAETEATARTRLRGRKPKAPEPAPSAKVNVTDPESRIMKGPTGYLQGYNAQAVVAADQLVLAADLTQSAADAAQLVPMLTQAADNAERAGFSGRVGTGARRRWLPERDGLHGGRRGRPVGAVDRDQQGLEAAPRGPCPSTPRPHARRALADRPDAHVTGASRRFRLTEQR